MTETEPGLYQMKDLVYRNYFLHEKEAPEFSKRMTDIILSPLLRMKRLSASKPKLAKGS